MTNKRIPAAASRPDEDWNFFSFPTLCGIAAGMLLFGILLFLVPYVYLMLISLGFCSFCGSHILFTGTRIRRERGRRGREEEDEMERRILAQRVAGDEAGATSKRARMRRRK